MAGNVASKTTLPVIGVPGDGGPLNGFDALLSTVQMPKGVPVATVAIGKAGAINAGYLAKYPAFIAPALPIATVATGTPLGICTVDKRASNPFKGPPSPGTPITGKVVLEATFPAK